jgi:SAM-dependent methyltransferase
MSNQWEDPRLIKEYIRQATNHRINWYEYEVNLPSLLALIPDGTRNILDFGCGPGDITKFLAEKYGSADGCDASRAMVKQAKSCFPELNFFIWNGLTALPKDKKAFYDIVFSKLTVHFLEDLSPFAQHIAEILKRGGSLIFSVPHPIRTVKKTDGGYWEKTPYDTEIGSYGIHVTMLHRSFQDFTKPFLEHGFVLTGIDEPAISREQAKKYKASPEDTALPKRLNIRLQRLY